MPALGGIFEHNLLRLVYKYTSSFQVIPAAQPHPNCEAAHWATVIDEDIEISDILDVVSREVAVVVVDHHRIGESSRACLLPVSVHASAVAGHKDAVEAETVELLEVGGSALALKGLDHDEVVAVLERGELDVFQGLEEG